MPKLSFAAWSVSSENTQMSKEMPDRKSLIIAASLLVLLIILVVVFFNFGTGKSVELATSSLLSNPDVDSSHPHAVKTITLFFLSEKDGLLHSEERDILESPSSSLMGRQLVEELLIGSKNGLICPFPSETKLREFYLTEEGHAYVDFSREIREEHPFGSEADIATVYSCVNSLTHNFSDIKLVSILIDGRESQTLGGHIDLTRPFVFRKDLIAK